MQKLVAGVLIIIALGLFAFSFAPQRFGVISSVSSSDTGQTLRLAVNNLISLVTSNSTTTANTFTQVQTFSAGFANNATSSGSKGIAITGGCFSVNGTCLTVSNLISLTSGVSGTLPAANGGTGATSLGPTFSVQSNALSATIPRGFQMFATSTSWQAGTTTLVLPMSTSTTIIGANCSTGFPGTFANVQFGNGTASTSMLMASSSATMFAMNLSMTIGQKLRIDIGTTSVPVDLKYVSCEWLQRQ